MPVKLFCSYAHKDETLLNELKKQLAFMVRLGQLETWHDRMIAPGAEWEPEILARFNEANIILLLISPDFIASDFCWEKEMTWAMERHRANTAVVIPVILRPCKWTRLPFGELQGTPKDNLPVSSSPDRDTSLLEVVEFIELAVKKLNASPAALSPSKPVVSISRLPSTDSALFGREAELKALDGYWAGDASVVTVVAEGGVGKTALINRWLANLKKKQWEGAKRVYGWSFYSQGTDRQTSSDAFITAALAFFGYDGPLPTSEWDRGVKVAELVRASKTLLLLDGLEPLQYPPGPMAGKLKDQAIEALLKELAGDNNGLCVVTTRIAVADLADGEHGPSPRMDLHTLSAAAGAELLASFGVDGTSEERAAVAQEFGGHALALTLLGTLLRDAHGGDLRHWREVHLLEGDVRPGHHAQKVMAAYARWLEPRQLAILGLVGLFDRPATPDLVAELRRDPPIPGLTDALVGLTQIAWKIALSHLRQAHLLAPRDGSNELDAHPLVREYFGEQLRQTGAWTAAHSRLYDFLRDSTPQFPDTLAGLQPLYQALTHGCAAGRHQEALHEVFLGRIERGEAFSTQKLGAFGAGLSALAGFFVTPWSEPVPGLTDPDRAFVVSDVGFFLRAVGRLDEAVQAMEAGLALRKLSKDWKNAASAAANLSEAHLLRGAVDEAGTLGHQAVELADRSGNAFLRLACRATLAEALAQAGQGNAAAKLFAEAEAMQADRQPDIPRLYSLRGYQYCDLLLDLGRHAEVSERATAARRIAEDNTWLLDIALDTLSLGRAALLADPGGSTAEPLLTEAVGRLRQAGQFNYLPRGLLARAALWRGQAKIELARHDMDEVRAIAERGGMNLHLADLALEETRLALALGDSATARTHLTDARTRIAAMGYHRRDKDVAELEQKLG